MCLALGEGGWEAVMRDTALVPTNPLKQEGPAAAPFLLFLEELEAGAGAGQEHPEALCGESRLSQAPWPQHGSLELTL